MKTTGQLLHSGKITSVCISALIVFAAQWPQQANAGNGVIPHAIGLESLAMGGADIALANGPFALAINPAGLLGAQARFASYAEVVTTDGIGHSDELGNDQSIDQPVLGTIGIAYSQPLGKRGNWAIGVGLFAQGGVGLTYKNLLNQFGTRDELSAEVGIFRLAPGVAWQATDKLSLGLALGINYAEGEQRVYPNTSVPPNQQLPNGFQGLEIKGLSGLSQSLKLGLSYQVNSQWRIGMEYASKADIRLKGGELILNFESQGLGRPRWSSASLSGFSLPQELGFGLSWLINSSLALAADLSWLDWSSAIRSTTLMAESPDSPNVPQTIQVTTPVNFRDQYVWALGLRWSSSPRTQWMLGYNYASHPIPLSSLSPILNVTTEQHIGAGWQHDWPSGWGLSGSLTYFLPVTENYSNPALGLGQNQQSRLEAFDFAIGVEFAW